MHVETQDCPVAVITRTPEPMNWVKLYFSAKSVSRGTSASLYGPDLSKWPTRAFDAFEILGDHFNLGDREMQKAAQNQL